ncbi:hypothetical protein DW182_02990 [Bacteroides sp. AM16-24]|jgi:hypothetical protein|uniref:hypothetical protein n=1 Tax=Bacteroides sp. AM16-24 TaxID=2292002 RepID=UPI000E4F0FEB|nr:hypothetical protein [Bacteroides sp. AM16-24]RHI11483.1 hypothetical protein DW182_02990 [Bacteroides sp. AM16-24]
MNTLINDISSFNLAIFGIGITIFTVIYSFIANKKEYMNEIADFITSGKACPETKAKYRIAENYVQKQKKANKAIASISVASLFIYVLCQLYIHCLSENIIFERIILMMDGILVIYLFVNLSRFFTSYFRYLR